MILAKLHKINRPVANTYTQIYINTVAQYMVVQYIKNQEEHHRKKTFLEEYVLFLKNSRCPTMSGMSSNQSRIDN